MKIDEIDKQIIYYYRNDFSRKSMCEKIGLSMNSLIYRLKKLKDQGLLKRWWED